MEPKIVDYCASKAAVSANQAKTVLSLMVEEECTVPFIARYRKEATGNLNETQIREIQKRYQEHLETEKRRESILKTLKKLEVLSPELENAVKKAETLTQLEEIYSPFKAKKKTKAAIARENGLEPLAEAIMSSADNWETLKGTFQASDKVKTIEEALEGAKSIIIEKIVHNEVTKQSLRTFYRKNGVFKSEKKKDAEKAKDPLKFKDYFEFSEPIERLLSPKASHRFLAMSRGRKQKVLKLGIDVDAENCLKTVETQCSPTPGALGCWDIVKECARLAYTSYIHPSLESEFIAELTKIAEEAATVVFGRNLKNLLLAPYLGSKTVMGIDPGVRTGCKVVVVDPTGKLLLDYVVYLSSSAEKTEKAKAELEQIVTALQVEYIAIGDGTFGRETLAFIEENVPQVKEGTVKATLISESGASVYSASETAVEEFPDKDVTVRGAVSIARRFQDPLSELVKIDPKSIGVGQYQHDVNQGKLRTNLKFVVEDCVNYVGVDLNTTSYHLLSFISGIGPVLAKNIIKHRDENGQFKNRQELLKVSRFSEKVFQQAAGFLRIYGGTNPLDCTFVHPERFETIENWCQENTIALQQLVGDKETLSKFSQDVKLKQSLGEHTFDDIVSSLKAPSQDPRTVFKSTEFNKSLKELSDVKVGSWYTGVVNNITNFGAFVNIGIKEAGLVHISQLADTFVEDPMNVFKVGQEIQVRAIEIDLERKRLALSCKQEVQAKPRAQRPPRKDKKKARPNQKSRPPRSQMRNTAFDVLKNFKVK